MMPATQMLERFFLKILWGSPPFIFIKFLIRIYHFLINPTQVLFWGGFALLFIYSDFGLFLWKFCMKEFWWMQMAKKIWCQPPKCLRDVFLKILWGSPPFILIKFLIRIYHFLINPPQLLFWGGFALLFLYSDFGLYLWKFWLKKFWWMQIAKELWCHPPKCWRYFF